ncbi:MAG: transposase [Myxococcota bacterium]|jgi:REP element-mobilizing transposase RayT
MEPDLCDVRDGGVSMEQKQRKKHRLPRDCYQGGDAFFITICATRDGVSLVDDPLKAVLVRFLESQLDINDGPVHAYVIMPDHLHLVIGGVDDAVKWTGWFKARVSFFAKKQGFAGQLWQRSFYDQGIRKPEKSMEIFQYMRNNPVEAGLVGHADQWTLKYGC